MACGRVVGAERARERVPESPKACRCGRWIGEGGTVGTPVRVLTKICMAEARARADLRGGEWATRWRRAGAGGWVVGSTAALPRLCARTVLSEV